ncbi:MAG: DtxR family transcriptional regulator, Mn-dependent transcriptional regulator [Frankiaceae bacterium]|jgi:DtxR family Mn-dependent transcriptional regulator|nr:DtxR family transcriptional regulator, Mn-dependent transcriptional regulator [Frankiaceae bacterium]
MDGYHPAVEEYLETVLELEESGIRPMRARIVERLGVSAPAVSETVRRLEREGYLTLDDSRAIRLTDKGRTFATSIMRRHRLAERLLTDVLKVPWSQVHEEAGRLEHAISPRLEAHLVALLGDPGTCPHGNPIPGSSNARDVSTQVPLTTTAAGTTVVVRRIDEELEAQFDRMQELEARGVMPGRMLQVLDGQIPDQQRFDSAGEIIALDRVVTAKVYVTVE